MSPPLRWPAETLWEQGAALLPGFTVEVWPQVDSSNTELMRRARAGQTDAVLLVAETQSAGRGRLGRDWQGERGASLLFSLGLPLAAQNWSGLSLAVGVSVAEALHPQLRLKWPNDVWYDDRKLGGILIETASSGSVRFVVIGVGINIQARSGDGLRTPPAALAELLPEASAPDALQRLVPPLLHTVLRFAEDGFAPWRERFMALDALAGREVVCTDGTQGVAQGVDGEGALLVHTAAGLQKISSAEVSVRPTH